MTSYAVLSPDFRGLVITTGGQPSRPQTGPFTLAATDAGGADEGSGTFTVTVPDAATLGDPWSYEMLVTSGVVSFAGGQGTVPVTAAGGGTPVKLRVLNGKTYLRSGSGATETRVA